MSLWSTNCILVSGAAYDISSLRSTIHVHRFSYFATFLMRALPQGSFPFALTLMTLQSVCGVHSWILCWKGAIIWQTFLQSIRFYASKCWALSFWPPGQIKRRFWPLWAKLPVSHEILFLTDPSGQSVGPLVGWSFSRLAEFQTSIPSRLERACFFSGRLPLSVLAWTLVT